MPSARGVAGGCRGAAAGHRCQKDQRVLARQRTAGPHQRPPAVRMRECGAALRYPVHARRSAAGTAPPVPQAPFRGGAQGWPAIAPGQEGGKSVNWRTFFLGFAAAWPRLDARGGPPVDLAKCTDPAPVGLQPWAAGVRDHIVFIRPGRRAPTRSRADAFARAFAPKAAALLRASPLRTCRARPAVLRGALPSRPHAPCAPPSWRMPPPQEH